MKFPIVECVPVASCHVTVSAVKSPTPFYLLPLVRLVRSPWASSSWGSQSPLFPQQMLQPSIIFVALWWHQSSESVSFSCWEPRTGPNTAATSPQGWAEGRAHCPPAAANVLPNAGPDAGTSLPHFLFFHWNSEVLFCKAAFYPTGSQPVLGQTFLPR